MAAQLSILPEKPGNSSRRYAPPKNEDRNDLGTGNDVSLVDICSSGSEVKFGSDAKCTQWAILANCEHSDFSDDVDEFVHCTPTWHM